ncbi:MAG: hypothetical protein HY525_06135 [Betaproteobacteria bacterium]|nr:hypothetical protein [Betaproteobacteria bacterium]
MGPLALSDFNGVNVVCVVARAMYEETGDSRFATPTLLKRVVAAG